jgi:hypothetical protein
MTQIEQGAYALFFFILADNLSFHFAGTAHGVLQGCRVACAQFVHIGFQPAEEVGIAQQAVFDDFGNAGGQFPLGQGASKSMSASTILG